MSAAMRALRVWVVALLLTIADRIVPKGEAHTELMSAIRSEYIRIYHRKAQP